MLYYITKPEISYHVIRMIFYLFKKIYAYKIQTTIVIKQYLCVTCYHRLTRMQKKKKQISILNQFKTRNDLKEN